MKNLSKIPCRPICTHIWTIKRVKLGLQRIVSQLVDGNSMVNILITDLLFRSFLKQKKTTLMATGSQI